MHITLMDFIILTLASFRLTRLFVYDRIFQSLRNPFFDEFEEDGETYLQPNGFIGELLSCHWCTGFWCAVVVCIPYFLFGMGLITLIFAVAGLASLIQWAIDHD
jgi:hypothetical protein